LTEVAHVPSLVDSRTIDLIDAIMKSSTLSPTAC
jgi:hypothetical protein